MLWVYILAGTAGFVLLVPAVMRALEGLSTDPVMGTIGFGATTFCICGLALQQFDMRGSSAFVAALALGGAVGAIHPEILKAVGRNSSGVEVAAEEASSLAEPLTESLSGDDD